MIVGNYTSYTKSHFYEIINVITNFVCQPLSVKCDPWNGLNNEIDRLIIPTKNPNFLPHLLLLTLYSIAFRRFTKCIRDRAFVHTSNEYLSMLFISDSS